MGKSPALIWCKTCEEWQPCHAEKPEKYGDFDRQQQNETRGIHFFRRLRKCVVCSEDFETVEFSGCEFDELLEASDAVKRVRKALRRSS